MREYITFPWDWKSFLIFNMFLVISIISWTICLWKIKDTPNNEVFLQIGKLLLISQVFYVIYSCFSYRTTLIKDNDPDDVRIATYSYFFWIFVSLYWTTYCLGHWIFAAKYWLVAYKLQEGS